jgi:hypothetical protein
MNKKLLTLISLLFLLITGSTFSQKSKKLIYGSVKDSIGGIENANIFNVNNKVGTVSNKDGYFRILASPGDTIQVSSIQHLTQQLVISDYIFKEGVIAVSLLTKIYNLDEFELRRTELIGSLNIDINKVQKDKRDSILRSLMDFSKIDMNAKVKNDYIDDRVRPQEVKTDPINDFFTAGAAIYIPFKYSERLWRLRRDLEYKKSFPYKILVDLGEEFFFEELQIPVDNYFHFLEYCNPLGIENLYLKKNFLEVIKILRTQSTSYLELIKKE